MTVTTTKKILVLQLARLGDIFQTWPVLNAIKRSRPDCELHLLTRSSFSSAAKPLASYSTAVDRYWTLETKEIIAPLVEERANVDLSLARLSSFVDELQAEQFDSVVNLSFSDFSAGLVKEIASETTLITGYTRFDDASLSIPDDTSAYFYAQVGPGRGNRLHVTDLFAAVSGVVLTAADWELQGFGQSVATAPILEAGIGSIVVHLGASDLAKTLGSSKWLQVVSGLLSKTENNVVLIGSKDEIDIAQNVASIAGDRQPINLVGRTQISDVFEIVRNAKLVIGGDSAPVQMASLTNTPVLNLSFPVVSPWETGPRASGSRILCIESEDTHTAEEIVREAVSILNGQSLHLTGLHVSDRVMPFAETRPQPQAFEWRMLQAIYMGEAFPEPQSEMFLLAIQRLTEVNELAHEQINALKKESGNKTASAILDRADEVMDQIVKLVPEVGPIVRWFRVERVRIGPMPIKPLIDATESIHFRLGEVLSLYGRPTGDTHDNVSLV